MWIPKCQKMCQVTIVKFSNFWKCAFCFEMYNFWGFLANFFWYQKFFNYSESAFFQYILWYYTLQSRTIRHTVLYYIPWIVMRTKISISWTFVLIHQKKRSLINEGYCIYKSRKEVWRVVCSINKHNLGIDCVWIY